MPEMPETPRVMDKTPIFAEPLYVGRPNIGDRDRLQARIEAMLDRNWLTNNGPYVKEFEQRIVEITGVRHCIAMCNATIALELAIRGAGLCGEVIIPSYTFIATAHALQWQEITPVFCDIDPKTHNIDPDRIESLITPRTTGIIGVHLWGRAAPVDALTRIADRHGLTLLFDAAHAFACSHRGVMIGNFGLAEVFSFHATKFLNTFEGGAVATNDDALAKKLGLMRNFGFSGYDNVIYIGTNGKMTEVCAAMGLTSIEAMDDFVRVNYRNYTAYKNALDGVPGIRLIEYDASEKNNYQYIIIEVDESQCGLSRDSLVQILHDNNVLARRYFYPGCHRMEPYRSFYPQSDLWLEETGKVAGRVISLPNGTAVDENTIGMICDLLRHAVHHANRIPSG
jgi:dTDP-4-amino-4,6-dideoxygalactose transaminase